jgi:hypothetical protein
MGVFAIKIGGVTVASLGQEDSDTVGIIRPVSALIVFMAGLNIRCYTYFRI